MANSSASSSPNSPDDWPSAHHVGDGRPPVGVELLAHPGHLGVADRLGPQVQPQGPRVGQLGVGLGQAGHGHDLLEPTGGAVDHLHPTGPQVVPEVLGEPHGLGQQVVLGLEVVDDQGRAGAGLLGHVGDAGLGEAPLGDDLRARPAACPRGAGRRRRQGALVDSGSSAMAHLPDRSPLVGSGPRTRTNRPDRLVRLR